MGDTALVLVVVTALAFDFTNGFHDTANAMAASIATKALRPKAAVAMAASLNLVGAFLSLSVAATIASGLVNTHLITLPVVFAGLAGGIAWNLATWYLGIPSSSSHALIGGVIGSTLAAAGTDAVKWHGLVQKVVIPAALSPLIAVLIAAVGTFVIFRISRGVRQETRDRGLRLGQVGAASMMSLAHGTNDAQKTMGIITLALITNGSLAAGSKAPTWVIMACAVALALGTSCGGWRIIRTLGKGLVTIEPPQGLAADSSSAATILLSSHFGYSLSTTHVASGSILGSGLGSRDGRIRWDVARRMVTAWLLTLPAAGLVGAGSYAAVHGIGGTAGVAVGFVVVVAGAGVLFGLSRRSPVSHRDLHEEPNGPATAETAAARSVAETPVAA
ncbi:inorganic phosphate transporter [Pseudofrankia asymbiotica]|uniref:Phosphate transporter n=1 Tax=Pseudofrankia asymbiotica TaxID=1834516 RepID=A0A1V2IAU7_9ACTN|nr:inorganic phosphate transporter [Pseudofrankia asymbiotica]ONH30323.1 phosphate transporter [Pseudofrankia asymbiotica]